MPRVRLAFDKNALWVTGQLYSPQLRQAATVRFMIDTGSSTTILSLRDAEMAGLEVETLPRSPVRSGGYGGPIELRLLKHLILILAAENSTAKSVELANVAVQYSSVEAKRRERMVYSIPTVLGTDVLTGGDSHSGRIGLGRTHISTICRTKSGFGSVRRGKAA